MLRYIRNLSTFRLLLLFLFAVAAALTLYGKHRESDLRERGGVDRKRIVDAMLGCADEFGHHLAAQESLAVALAIQCNAAGAIDDENFDRLLRSTLEQAPDYIQGIGVSFPRGPDQSRKFAYRPKGEESDPGIDASHFADVGEMRQATGREINIDRRIGWTLLSTPPTEALFRFSSLLTVSLGGSASTSEEGEVFVKGRLDWLVGLLKRLNRAGAEFACCLTPDREVLWLINNRLYFDKDFEPSENPGAEMLARVRRYAGEGNVGDDFVKADILGTGWLLLVVNPSEAGQLPYAAPLALVVMLLAGGALIADAVLSAVRTREPPPGASIRTKIISAQRDAEMRARGSIFSQAYTLLFKYRMTDPHKERLESELRVARQIQFSLVPDAFPAYSEWREFDLYSMLEPAREVGGDFYDFFMLDSDRMLIAVGDVSGKGVPAALYMAVCRTALRTLAREARDPGELLTRLNDMLVRENQSGLYVTTAVFIVNLPTGDCVYSIAGHPAPVWNARDTGLSTFVEDPRETFIGLKAGLTYPVGTLRLAPGDTLLLYTDGVTEARDIDGNDLYFTGLMEMFNAAVKADSCQALLTQLNAALQDYMGHREQQDDITLLAFRYWGPGGQKMIRKQLQKSARTMPNVT